MFGISRLNKPQPTNIKKRVIELQVAGWLGKTMSNKNWAAFTCPLPFIVFIFYWIGPSILSVAEEVRVHENVHCLQDQGNLCFLVSWVKYYAEMIRQRWTHGSWMQAYQNNKYEIAAYAVEDKVLNGTEPYPDWAK